MKQLFVLCTLLALVFLPTAARAVSSPETAGVGAHGYDFMVGTWSCKNNMPSPMGGPAATTLSVTHGVGGSLAVHVSGTNFDVLGYVVYAPKTKTWESVGVRDRRLQHRIDSANRQENRLERPVFRFVDRKDDLDQRYLHVRRPDDV